MKKKLQVIRSGRRYYYYNESGLICSGIVKEHIFLNKICQKKFDCESMLSLYNIYGHSPDKLSALERQVIMVPANKVFDSRISAESNNKIESYFQEDSIEIELHKKGDTVFYIDDEFNTIKSKVKDVSIYCSREETQVIYHFEKDGKYIHKRSSSVYSSNQVKEDLELNL